MMKQNFKNSLTFAQETPFDISLRPKRMSDFIGQKKIKENLKIIIEAAKQRNEALEHILLYGPPGIGKTSLAYIIAHEMGVEIKTTTGPAIERIGDLGSLLTNLENREILFIDEIHRLNHLVEEVLYPAMEDYSLDIILGKGPGARTLRLDLPHFTIVGATTRIGLLSGPLRDRFGLTHRLDYYSEEDIKKIIKRSAKILNIEINEEGVSEIAKRSRKTPRVANRLLKRVRDFSQVKADGKITKDITLKALALLEIDDLGLDNTDRKLMQIMVDKFSGGPVGVKALASAASEDEDTIAEVYEPFLLQLGFVSRTPRGRIVTKLGLEHLKRYSGKLQTLF